MTCVYVRKIILRHFLRQHLASGGHRFEKCPTLVLNYEGTSQLLIISEKMRLISQKMSRKSS